MHPRIPIAALCCAVAAVAILPASSTGKIEVGQKHNGLSKCDERAFVAYEKAHDVIGKAVGRHLAEDGKLTKRGPVPMTNEENCEWAGKLEAAIAPPPAPELVSYSEPVASAPVVSDGCSLDYIRSAESGGNYSAVNPASGAGGAYQFLPSTWESMGGEGLPQDAPPEVQDAMAAKLYAEAGSEPWEVC